MKKIWLGLITLSVSLSAMEQPRAVIVVIDGVRAEEARDKNVMPYLQKLKQTGLYYDQFEISNSSGISLPAYADILAGIRQAEITQNDLSEKDLHSYSPTIFEEAVKQGKLLEKEMAVVSSWKKICALAYTQVNPKTQVLLDCKEDKPVKYEDSRIDENTFASVKEALKTNKPRFLFVHFGDADEEAHAQSKVPKEKQVKTFYLEALTRADAFIEEIDKTLQEDPFYKNQTYLFVTTDHGRDDKWTDHGKCLLCESYKQSFLTIKGPEIKSRKVSTPRDHRDIAPTVARLFGFKMTHSKGRNLLEGNIAPERSLSSKP